MCQFLVSISSIYRKIDTIREERGKHKDRFGSRVPEVEASHNDVPPSSGKIATPALITTRKENHKKSEKDDIGPSTFPFLVEITETPNDLQDTRGMRLGCGEETNWA